MRLGKKLMPRLAEGPGRLYAVPPWFRAEIADALPGLEAGTVFQARSCWRFLSLLLSRWNWQPASSPPDSDDELAQVAASDDEPLPPRHAIAIYAEECAWCEDRLAQYHAHRRYSMRRFLCRFEQAVGLGLGTELPHIPGGRVRGRPYLFSPVWPDAVHRAVEDLISKGPGPIESLVALDTGEPWSRTTAIGLRDILRRHCADEVQRDDTVSSEAKRIVGYLNRLPARGFINLIDGGFFGAYSAASDLVVAGELSSDTCLRLTAIQQCPAPLYLPSAKMPRRTDRVFENEPGIGMLPSRLRPSLLPIVVELDLVACQLAIVAAWWPIEPIQELLSRGGDVWASLLEKVGLPNHARASLKKSIYASCFGMQRKRLIAEAMNEEGFALTQDEAKALFDHDLLVSIRGAFRRRAREMRVAAWSAESQTASMPSPLAGLATPLGTGIPISFKGRRVRDVGRAVAQEVQALEVWLIESVYAVAMTKDSAFVVVLHQHDGISILPKALWTRLQEGPVQDPLIVPYEQWVAAVDQAYQAVERRVTQVSDYVGQQVYTRPRVAYAPAALPGPVDPYQLVDEFITHLLAATAPEGRIPQANVFSEWTRWCRSAYGCPPLVGKHRLADLLRAAGCIEQRVRIHGIQQRILIIPI
jgi:hypothetical protein